MFLFLCFITHVLFQEETGQPSVLLHGPCDMGVNTCPVRVTRVKRSNGMDMSEHGHDV